MVHHDEPQKSIMVCERRSAEITLWVKGPEDKGDVLMIRQKGRVDNEPDQGGKVLPLIDHVAIQFRYLDSTTNEWRDEWDSTGVVKHQTSFHGLWKSL